MQRTDAAGCSTQNHRQPAPKPKKGKASSKALLANVSLKGTLGGGMDSGLSVFHALGKLLHNKRDSTLAGDRCRNDSDVVRAAVNSADGKPAALGRLPHICSMWARQ